MQFSPTNGDFTFVSSTEAEGNFTALASRPHTSATWLLLLLFLWSWLLLLLLSWLAYSIWGLWVVLFFITTWLHSVKGDSFRSACKIILDRKLDPHSLPSEDECSKVINQMTISYIQALAWLIDVLLLLFFNRNNNVHSNTRILKNYTELTWRQKCFKYFFYRRVYNVFLQIIRLSF